MILVVLGAGAFAKVPQKPVPPPPPPEPVATPAPTGPDRSGPPPVVPPVLMTYPEPEVHEIGPGVDAWFVRAPGVRKIEVEVVLRRGYVELGGLPTQLGRATGYLADAAAGDLSSAELATERDLNELELWSNAALHSIEVGIGVPKEGLGRSFDLQKLVLREPTFPKKDVKRWTVDQTLFYTVNGPSSQDTVARSALAFAWFPANHPYGARPDLAQLPSVKTKALLATWDQWLHAAPITVLVVGDVAWADVEGPVKAMVEGLGKAEPPGTAIAVPTPKSRVIAVDMPGQDQVAVELRLEAPRVDDPDAAAMRATDFILGGTFLSRLNRVLREEKGFTYGAGSYYRSDLTWGNETIRVDVKPENVAETVKEIEAQMARLAAEPVDPSELDAARRSLASDWNRTFETADRAAGLYRVAMTEQKTVDQLRAPLAALEGVTAADVQRVAATWLGPERARVWVLVGPRSTLEAQLAGSGLTAEWIDPQAAILGKF